MKRVRYETKYLLERIIAVWLYDCLTMTKPGNFSSPKPVLQPVQVYWILIPLFFWRHSLAVAAGISRQLAVEPHLTAPMSPAPHRSTSYDFSCQDRKLNTGKCHSLSSNNHMTPKLPVLLCLNGKCCCFKWSWCLMLFYYIWPNSDFMMLYDLLLCTCEAKRGGRG